MNTWRSAHLTFSYLIIACSSINPVNNIDIHISQSFSKRKKLRGRSIFTIHPHFILIISWISVWVLYNNHMWTISLWKYKVYRFNVPPYVLSLEIMLCFAFNFRVVFSINHKMYNWVLQLEVDIADKSQKITLKTNWKTNALHYCTKIMKYFYGYIWKMSFQIKFPG